MEEEITTITNAVPIHSPSTPNPNEINNCNNNIDNNEIINDAFLSQAATSESSFPFHNLMSPLPYELTDSSLEEVAKREAYFTYCKENNIPVDQMMAISYNTLNYYNNSSPQSSISSNYNAIQS